MNWTTDYKATWHGVHEYAKTLKKGDGQTPVIGQIIAHQCGFILGMEAIATEYASKDSHPEYIPPTMWRLLLREWRRDAKMLRDFEDSLGGES